MNPLLASLAGLLALLCLTSLAWWQARRREQYWRHLFHDRLEAQKQKLRHRLRSIMVLERQFSSLRALAARMTLTSTFDDFLKATIATISAMIQPSGILVYVANEREQVLKLIAQHGLAVDEAARWQQVKCGEGAIGQAARSSGTVLLRGGAGAPGGRSQVAVPLVARARTVGVLAVMAKSQREFAPEEIRLLETIADYLAMGAENCRLYKNLRHYVQQITRAQEYEQRRIARELHDSPLQSLIAILHNLESFLAGHQDLSMNDSRFLWDLVERIKEAIHELRYLSYHLRPAILDDLGLLPAVDWLLDEVRRENNVEARLVVSGSQRRLSAEAELSLFRIVQEALHNVVRHSGATQLEVNIQFGDQEIVVIVRDNGIGFQVPGLISDLPRAGKLGLVGIEERVHLLQGKLVLRSQPGEGTTVRVKVPLPGNTEEKAQAK